MNQLANIGLSHISVSIHMLPNMHRYKHFVVRDENAEKDVWNH